MADEVEVTLNGPERNQPPREQVIRDEINAMSDVEVVAKVLEIATSEDRQRAASESMDRVTDSIRATRGQKVEIPGDPKNPNSAKSKASEVMIDAQRILAAAQSHTLNVTPDGGQPIPEFGQKVIRKISDRVTLEDININSSQAMYRVLSRLATDDSLNFDNLRTEFKDEFVQLQNLDGYMFNKFKNGLVELYRSEGHSESVEEAAEILFGMKSISKELAEDETFEGDWERVLRQHFSSEDDKKVVQAMYSPAKFAEFIKEMEDDPVRWGILKTRHEDPAVLNNNVEKSRRISDAIEREFLNRYARIFGFIHTGQAGQQFEEMAQANFTESANTAREKLSRALTRLSEQLSDSEVRAKYGLTNIDFHSSGSTRLVNEKKILDSGGREKSVLNEKVVPIVGKNHVEARDFIIGVREHANSFIDHQAFLHNVQVVFTRGVREGTFWGQVASYAEGSMKALDIDDLSVLPDSDKIMSAYQLYSKYVEEDFAQFSWRHQTGRFQNDFSTKYSVIQQGVMEDLQKLYPELREPQHKWRLEQAMNMGIGISRGVFLTEVQAAASADPDHKGTGDAAFQSYYTNDNAALAAFNLRHTWDRWKAPGVTKGPLIHMPVEGLSHRFMRHWNHRMLWDYMQKRQKTYLDGTGDITNENDRHNKYNLTDRVMQRKAKHLRKDERLKTFVEYVMNIGKVGSPIDRKGWRFHQSFEGWLKYDEGPKGTQLNRLESWKAVENIGYEAAWYFGHQKAGLLEGKLEPDLGGYLYDKYISRGQGGSYMDYKESITKELEGEGFKNPRGNDEFMQHRTDRVFMSRVYANMIRDRIPTKFLRVERDRYMEDGIRGWEKVRSGLQWTGADGAKRMDRGMKNIALVEQYVRNRVSDEMKEQVARQVEAGGAGSEDLSTVVINTPYRVTREVVEQFMRDPERQIDQNEVQDTLNLFDGIQSYLDTDDYINEFAEKIRTADKQVIPFSLATEELDSSFLAYRNMGNAVLKRALGDIGTVESDVNKNIEEFMGKLHSVAINGQQNFGELVEHIGKAKHALEGIHGPPLDHEVADHMARIAIAYFKKDAVASNPITHLLFAKGGRHSLAAEFAGGSWKGVWEWGTPEIDSFILELEKHHILPSVADNLNVLHKDDDGAYVTERKFLGIPLGKTVRFENEGGPTARTLRSDMGGTYVDVAKQILGKYLPLALLALVVLQLKRAFKETKDK